MTDRDDDTSPDAHDAASQALETLSAHAEESASLIQAAFAEAGGAIEQTLVSAARTGELSFEAMAQSVLKSLASLAIDQLFAVPIGQAASGLSGALSAAVAAGVGAARADGGPVTAGTSYLVGERGPELFTPAGAGMVSPAVSALTVNVTTRTDPGGEGVDARTPTQIAAAVSRAMARARRVQ